MKFESRSGTTWRIAGFARSTNPIWWQLAAFALAFALLTLPPSAEARTFKKLHTFVGNSKDGAFPFASLVMDANGNLYGTTWEGGANAFGTVFELMPRGNNRWTEKLLHSFGASGDGAFPVADLILDSAGSLYGTTSKGGMYGSNCGTLGNECGTVFELSPRAHGGWKEKILHSFGGSGDGTFPQAGLIFDSAGNLYGTTTDGGAHSVGTVFELSPGANGTWTEKILHSFGSGQDGYYPYGGLILDKPGNLYGTASSGGASGRLCANFASCGIAFQLTPGSNGSWTETVLHNFGSGADGNDPLGGLIMDPKGNLYGTTAYGGAYASNCDTSTCGIVFQLTGANGTWTETVLHSFGNGKDGNGPFSSLILDQPGNLYGTTSHGGTKAPGLGTVFELKASAHGKWTEKLLHSFGGTDGQIPTGGLFMDAAGNLYGATSEGGVFSCAGTGCGVAFKLTP